MVNQACQTDLPFIVHSLHKFKSIPLADIRHAVTNDHSYAALLTDSPVVPAKHVPGVSGKDFPKSKRMLDFSEIDISDFSQIDYQEEEIEDERIPTDVSDHEESDISDLSDYIMKVTNSVQLSILKTRIWTKNLKFLTMTRKRSPRAGLMKIAVIFTKSESSWYLKAN